MLFLEENSPGAFQVTSYIHIGRLENLSLCISLKRVILCRFTYVLYKKASKTLVIKMYQSLKVPSVQVQPGNRIEPWRVNNAWALQKLDVRF